MSQTASDSSHRVKHFLWLWGPFLLMVALIYGLSTDIFSSANTLAFTRHVAELLGLTPSDRALRKLNVVLRRGAHLTEYFLLGFLLFGTLKGTLPKSNAVSLSFVTLVFAAVLAVMDEMHQATIPSRTAALGDLKQDIIGICVGILTALTFYRISGIRRSGLP